MIFLLALLIVIVAFIAVVWAVITLIAYALAAVIAVIRGLWRKHNGDTFWPPDPPTEVVSVTAVAYTGPPLPPPPQVREWDPLTDPLPPDLDPNR